MCSAFTSDPCPDGARFGALLFNPTLAIPRHVSSAFSSGCPRVVGGSQGGNRDQSATLGDGALGASNSKRIGAGNVKEEFVVCLFASRSSFVSRPSSFIVLVVNGVHGPPIEMRMVGRQW